VDWLGLGRRQRRPVAYCGRTARPPLARSRLACSAIAAVECGLAFSPDVDSETWAITRRGGWCSAASKIPHTKNHRSQTPACQRRAIRSTLPEGCRTPDRTRAPAATLRPPYTMSSTLAAAETTSSHERRTTRPPGPGQRQRDQATHRLRRHGHHGEQHHRGTATAGHLLRIATDRTGQATPAHRPVQAHQRIAERHDRGRVGRDGPHRRQAHAGSRGAPAPDYSPARHAFSIASPASIGRGQRHRPGTRPQRHAPAAEARL
jgi:hypothetical protein